jgi:hypothetical protein
MVKPDNNMHLGQTGGKSEKKAEKRGAKEMQKIEKEGKNCR